MDEKQSLGSSHSSFHPSTDADVEQVRPRWHASYIPYRDRTLRRICIVAILIVLAFWKFRQLLLYYPMLHGGTDHQRMSGNHLSHLSNGGNKTHNVSLEAHIMSKCPDAKACLQELVVPAMEKFHDKVDFELSFIGSIDPHSDAVSCKHGPSECLGDMILLCAAQLYPDPKLSLGFANCLIDDYDHIPQRYLVESCCMEHGLDFKKINDCISEEGHAQGLLRDSVEKSAKANIKTSCTVRLEQKIWCVTDGKTDCNDGANLDDLVKDIKTAYDKLNP